MKKIFLLAAAVIFALNATAIEKINPKEVDLDAKRLEKADELINKSIADKVLPGAVLAIVKDGKLAYLKAYGNKSVYPKVEPMTTNTIFDLASCSKVVGTAMSMAHLLESGGYRLTDPVSMYLPKFQPYVDPKTGEKTVIRIIDLLTHSSGLPAYAAPEDVIKKMGKADPDLLMDYICTLKRIYKPTTDFVYSCLNFITLQNILQKITGQKLCDYAQENIFDVLGMTSTTYMPKVKRPDLMSRVAPTEKQPNGSVLLGEVHDPLARIMNFGNSGNAGVFSCAEDLAALAAALMEDGEYEGKHVLGKLTIERMSKVPVGFEHIGRSLGWDNYSDYSSCIGNILSRTRTINHTGYTGPSFVVDLENDIAVILLAHRVHPADKGSAVRLRAQIANIVAGAVID